MRILFVDQQTSKPYTVDTPKKEPLGGSQSAICYYAAELRKAGHEVILVNYNETSSIVEGVQHHPIQWYYSQRGFYTDIIILCSAILPSFFNVLESNFRYKLSICWQGHHGNEPPLMDASKYLYHVDLFAFVSDYQRNHFCNHFNLPHEKSILMLNGISPFFHNVDITRKSDRCIFFSNPQRGLNALANIWPRVVKAHPRVKLEVFSSEKTYGKKEDNAGTLEDYDMLRKIPNVTVHEPAGQEHLATMCAQSAFLVYPTHFIETSCIVYLEASAAGALPIITDMGVFPSYDFECVHYGPNFFDTFAKATIQALDSYYANKSEYSVKSKERSDRTRAHHHYATLAKSLLETLDIYIEKKQQSMVRQKELREVTNDRIKVYMGESTPLFFENIHAAATFFLLHGNHLMKNNMPYAAEKAYTTSWDIMNSSSTCSNMIEMYSRVANPEKLLLWVNTSLSRYGVNLQHIDTLMKQYKNIKFFDRIAILEYVHNIITESYNETAQFLIMENTINLATVYGLIGKHTKSLEVYRTTIRNYIEGDSKKNDDTIKKVFSNVIFISNYDFKDDKYFDDCLNYEKYITPPNYTMKPFSKNTTGKIRLGFISGDFINHPVLYILNGFIEHINKERFEVFLFNDANKKTASLEYALKHVKENVELNGRVATECIQLIEDRNIDILIDMCGHTSSNVAKIMDIIRTKPAKVIANYFAYPGTTAIKAVDYKLGDAICLPDSSKHLFTEEFQYIQGGMHCYRPTGNYVINKKPMIANNIRLGVFNNPRKFSTAFRTTLVKILKALPTSTVQFVYTNFDDVSYVGIIKAYFQERGVDTSRLKFSCANNAEAYSARYNEVDITLDTFPYNGGTISIESLYFGTPYITLLGDDYVARIGASIVHQIGHPELIATTIEEYIQKIVDLASDTPRLQNYHSSLHGDVMRSTLGNGKLFAKKFEQAVNEMLEAKGFGVPMPVPKYENPWDLFKRRYVISLPQSTDRRVAITQEMKRVNMEFEFFDAIDGRNNYEGLRDYCYKKGIIGDRGAKELSPGALGCLLSHRAIFEKEWAMRNDENYWILIMEDDIRFAPNLDMHKYVENWPSVSNIVKLAYWNNYRPNYKKEIGNPYFVELIGGTCSTLCYAVHSSCFRILTMHKYETAIDMIVDYPMHGCKTLADVPREFYRLGAHDTYFEGVCAETQGNVSIIHHQAIGNSLIQCSVDTTGALKHINKVVYINLDKRSDRKKEMEGELAKMGLSGERFSAIEHTRGAFGCSMSHLAVLKDAKANKYKNILVLEDDFQFIVDRPTFEKELQSFFDLNIPYDVLMLSYNCYEKKPYNTIVSRAINVQTASGYIVHERFYDTLIHVWEEGLQKLIETGNEPTYSLDQCWKSLQPSSQWFLMNTRIGVQRESYSDIEKRRVNYKV